MGNGSVRIRTPRLWAIGCVLMLGITVGIVVADARPGLVFPDIVSHDTYFVVAHLHYVLHLPVVFGFFAGWYYLFPRITGYDYFDALGRIHFWLLLIGVNAALTPQVVLASGLLGRVVNVPDGFRRLNLVSWIGGYISAAGMLVFFVNMVLSFLRRRPAD
jgi:cytochrome c oxidase subunit 1